jgi:hypothetical protein
MVSFSGLFFKYNKQKNAILHLSLLIEIYPSVKNLNALFFKCKKPFDNNFATKD